MTRNIGCASIESDRSLILTKAFPSKFNIFLGSSSLNYSFVRYFALISLLISSILMLGCDDMPNIETNSQNGLSSMKDDVVAHSGRSSYQWNPTASGFEITRESRVQYIDRIADSFQGDRIGPNPEDNQPWVRPGWLDDDSVYKEFRAFIETGEMKKLSEIELEVDLDSEAIHIDPDIENTYWLANEKIHVVNTRQPKNKIIWDAPLENAKGLCVGKNEEHLYLFNDQEVIKVSIADRIVVAKLQLDQPLIEWEIAKECDAICGATHNKELIAIDEKFEGIRIARGYKLANNYLAIHPRGIKILAVGTNGAIRWNLKEGDSEFDNPIIDPQSFVDVSVSCGTTIDSWMRSYIFSQHVAGGPKRFTYLSKYNSFDTPGLGHAIFDCAKAKPYKNTLVYGKMRDRNSKFKLFMFDFSIQKEAMSQSEPAFFPMDDNLKQLQPSRDGTHVCVRVANRIELYERPASDQTGLNAAADTLEAALQVDRMDLIEKLLEELRSRDWPEKGWTGEFACMQFIDGIASQWSQYDHPSNKSNEKAVAFLVKLNKWLDEGGMLARICSGRRYLFTGDKAKGPFMSDNVSQEDWKIFEENYEQCNKELAEILKQEELPACAYVYKCQQLLWSRGDLNDFETYIEKCMSRHPRFKEIHHSLLMYLLPRFSGHPGEANAYLNAVANLYKPEIRDYVFALIAADHISLIGIPAANQRNAGYDLKRINKGTRYALNTAIRIRQVVHEWTVSIAKDVSDVALSNDLADWYLTVYPQISADAYGYPSYETIFRRKIEMLNALVEENKRKKR